MDKTPPKHSKMFKRYMLFCIVFALITSVLIHYFPNLDLYFTIASVAILLTGVGMALWVLWKSRLNF